MKTKEPLELAWLVDDDMVYQMLGNVLLVENNLVGNLQVYSNGLEAIKSLRKGMVEDGFAIPKVIFLDLAMPVMDGWEFLDEFSKMPSDIKAQIQIIVLSSSIDPKDKARAERYECVKRFCRKPIDHNQLSNVIYN